MKTAHILSALFSTLIAMNSAIISKYYFKEEIEINYKFIIKSIAVFFALLLLQYLIYYSSEC